MVELKGPGYTSHSYNNVLIIITAIIIATFIGFIVYRLVNNLMLKKRQKQEKARLKQQKKLDKQTSVSKKKQK
ncbi:unnamed protein product [Rotaria sordida]|uniref:Uncharacterized protein n=1 Tax=Rotaria sordida TaxID=392033 RepID=A0A813TF43_9BILA|nr:unnamed protein product [Rotaria sordida]CAF0818510.1 unnamed protein product [Rotaria sordida]CAF0832449.1 unnamed protein product [Rotaria sordida]